MLETVILLSLSAWFVFYVINHATLLAAPRRVIGPILWPWLRKLLSCPICLCFWAMCALTLFTGFVAPLLACPPLTLFCELAFQRLKPKDPSP